ncbi:Cyclic AMP-responsive element-binding protein 5 [Acipenser ruthenus]|uniref:Cyclic AMP-responsive element-binding protein 5 n=1 Tax=Acipenser ruthenus TaxID=7906 RepID=A0A662YXG4_ACIRT|nr:Cyclic AMP-responsive element-binding protein 5 [Acipenser ruthenus]
MIHRHKHEMTLKFPSIKNDNMLSDQTPTPTRFLKNCEEVGIFNELDCSIEQEFRKAQEEEDNKRVEHFDAWLSRTIVTPAPPHKDDKPRHQHCDSASHAVPTVQFGHHTSTFDKQTDRMERQMSMGSNMMGMQGPNLSNSCASPQVPTMHSEAKLVSPAAQQMQASQTLQSPQPTGGRRRRVVDEDPDERRRKFLERNRAAATRCRQKRKVWVISLEKKAEELTQTNMQLQNEVTMLKTEVTQLKQLLLTHKDCPITAMQKESQGYLSPENSPPGSPAPVCSQQQVIQHNTITTSTAAVSEAVGNSALSQLANHRTDMNPVL